MMLSRSRNRRPGFTLLEVLLATVIGIMLLGGLYVTFEMVLKQSDAGRVAVENGDLSRAIVNRMTLDLSGSLGPLPPKSGGGLPQDASNSSSSSSSGGSSSSSSSTTPTTGTGAATGSTTGTETETETSSTETTTAETSVAADVPFQGGVFGSDKQLTLYVSRVPTDLLDVNSAAQTALGGDPKPDLRRITYYLGATGGLCRQEQFLVTADGVRNSIDPDFTRETVDLIAEEVVDVTFEYYDGGLWSSTWAGDDENEDGKTVKGPPRAIRMTLVIEDGNGTQKRVEHVFALRAAVGTYTPPLPPAETTTTTEGM
jgi:type II secretory pathway pseudopilin PulG